MGLFKFSILCWMNCDGLFLRSWSISLNLLHLLEKEMATHSSILFFFSATCHSACGDLSSLEQGLHLCPQHWEPRVLTREVPSKLHFKQAWPLLHRFPAHLKNHIEIRDQSLRSVIGSTFYVMILVWKTDFLIKQNILIAQ